MSQRITQFITFALAVVLIAGVAFTANAQTSSTRSETETSSNAQVAPDGSETNASGGVEVGTDTEGYSITGTSEADGSVTGSTRTEEQTAEDTPNEDNEPKDSDDAFNDDSSTSPSDDEQAEKDALEGSSGTNSRTAIDTVMYNRGQQPSTIRERQMEARAELRANLQTRMESQADLMVERRIALGQRIVVRLTNIHNRLTVLADRVGTYIEGVQDEEIINMYLQAQGSLEAADMALADAQLEVDTWLTMNLEQDLEELRAMINENQETFKQYADTARTELRTAHRMLIEVIFALRRAETNASANVQVSS